MAVVEEILTVVAVAGVTVILVRFLQRYFHFRKMELAIPGPPSLPLIGNALDFVGTSPDTVLKTILRLKGNLQLFRFSMLQMLAVVVSDPADIEEVVLCKEFNDKPVFFYSLLNVAARKGLLQASGHAWRTHRKWLAPAFKKNILDTFVGIFSEEAKGYVDRVVAGQEVDVTDNLRRYGARVFARTNVAADASAFDDDLMSVLDFVEIFMHSVNERSFNPLLWSDQVFARTPLGRKVHKMLPMIDSPFQKMLAARRAELNSDKLSNNFERTRHTLMDIMIDTSCDGEGMSDDDILDEMKTFFVANAETSVSTLSWMLKVLSLQPEVQEQVYAELCAVLGDRVVTAEDLPRLKYLDCVVKECLRMFPPVVIAGRTCHAETKLSGHTIPPGCLIIINFFSAHRDPKYWVDPERFNPDRFLPENSKGRHPLAFVPFSAGSRNCIGQKYASMSLPTFLATTLRALKVLPTDDHKDLDSLAENVAFDMTSRLVGGTRVRFQRRDS